jgi:hypothetical protein
MWEEIERRLRLYGLQLGGYQRRMGIPPDHLTMMADAALETNTVAVFRANRPVAIPLILRGAVGKPKALSVPGFRSNETTGVLTAFAAIQYQVAYRAGFYVVQANGARVACRYAGRGANRETFEIPLVNSPYWPVLRGQVIDPSGHPVVGDYDLLGVIPLESPGRNLVPVPANPAKGDWMGPDVARYVAAVNPRLDRPRVLHGAQDQFHNEDWGGFTNDYAYAVLPDRRVCHLEGEGDQQRFYQAFGRTTAVGEYPGPPPGTPVRDMLFERRRWR